MTPRLASAALLACILLAGCGDDGSERERPVKSAEQWHVIEDRSTRDFRKRFEEVCRATQRAVTHAQRQELGSPGPQAEKPTRAELQRFYEEVVVPARRAEAETLTKLDPPPELRAVIEAYLAEHRAATDVLGGELALIRQPGIEETALAKADAAADAAGIPRC